MAKRYSFSLNARNARVPHLVLLELAPAHGGSSREQHGSLPPSSVHLLPIGSRRVRRRCAYSEAVDGGEWRAAALAGHDEEAVVEDVGAAEDLCKLLRKNNGGGVLSKLLRKSTGGRVGTYSEVGDGGSALLQQALLLVLSVGSLQQCDALAFALLAAKLQHLHLPAAQSPAAPARTPLHQQQAAPAAASSAAARTCEYLIHKFGIKNWDGAVLGALVLRFGLAQLRRA